MTSRPPELGPAKDEPTVAEPHSEKGDASPASPARRIAIVGSLVVAAVVVAILVFDSDDLERDTTDETGPEQGVACPFLREAFDEFEVGNDAAFAEAVRVAAREAEFTLERSGQTFGGPEELALELRAALANRRTSAARIRESLSHAEEACSQLGRWPER